MEILFFLMQEVRELPAWTRWIFTVMMFATVLGVTHFVSPMVGVIVGAGVLGVVGLVGLVQYFIAKRRKKKAEEFGGELQGNSEATPGGRKRFPARRARLADLRKNFGEGSRKDARATGKDIYKLPWYVIVGEPGAGKTEAIRHSGVGFPPGMQDEFQGVGGNDQYELVVHG